MASAPYITALNKRRRELVTPEGLTLSLTVAGRGARFGALMLDYIIISAILFFLTLFLIYLAFGVAGVGVLVVQGQFYWAFGHFRTLVGGRAHAAGMVHGGSGRPRRPGGRRPYLGPPAAVVDPDGPGLRAWGRL